MRSMSNVPRVVGVFALIALLTVAATTAPTSLPTAQNTTPNPTDVAKMLTALPGPGLVPKTARHVLVFGRATGWVHPSIPIACAAFAAMGPHAGAYQATISYDPAIFTPDSLRQFDAIALIST